MKINFYKRNKFLSLAAACLTVVAFFQIGSLNAASTYQSGADSTAKSYQRSTPMSYNSLLSQLKFEGYEEQTAIRAIDKLHIDFYQNAVKEAASYVKNLNMNEISLFSQLKSEAGARYTENQAFYAVNHTYGKHWVKDGFGWKQVWANKNVRAWRWVYRAHHRRVHVRYWKHVRYRKNVRYQKYKVVYTTFTKEQLHNPEDDLFKDFD